MSNRLRWRARFARIGNSPWRRDNPSRRYEDNASHHPIPLDLPPLQFRFSNNDNHLRVYGQELESLSDRADIVIGEAEGTLSAISRQFVHEAQLVGKAMNGLAEMQVLSLAGEVPLEDMEFLADRIVERSEMDERAIRKLDASISGDVR